MYSKHNCKSFLVPILATEDDEVCGTNYSNQAYRTSSICFQNKKDVFLHLILDIC